MATRRYSFQGALVWSLMRRVACCESDRVFDNEHVTWSGKHRAALTGQGVYPRPVQNPLPIWLGVGGTPGSFARAGALGLPLMVAIIGGETRRFRPLIDVYREAGERAGHPPERLKVGVHSLGY